MIWISVRAAIALSGVAALMVAAVPGAGAHGAMSEFYTASAPQPYAAEGQETGCVEGGEEGVNKDSHPFQLGKAGILSVILDNFEGDWDLHVVSQETGETLASAARRIDVLREIRSGGGGLGRNESLSVQLMPSQPVLIVACNFAGSPTATVTYGFSPKAVASTGHVAVPEGDAGTRSAVFTVSLHEPRASTVTVDYATADGTATADEDYSPRQGTLSFAPGATHATVKVPVAGDTSGEDAETFTLRLSQPSGAILGTATGMAVIVDDDSAAGAGPHVAIGDAAVHEGRAGARSAVFTVSLSEPSGSAVTVSFATASGSARKSGDYSAKSGTITFPAGTTSQTVKVVVTPDIVVEDDETFSVLLSGGAGAVISDAAGLGTILDDD